MTSREIPRQPHRLYLRRAVTIPGVVLSMLVLLAALPVLLPLAFVVDLARAAGRRSFVSVRIVLFGVCFLATEVLGLALLLGVWLSSLGWPALRAARTWPVQRLYTAMHYVASPKALPAALRSGRRRGGDARPAAGASCQHHRFAGTGGLHRERARRAWLAEEWQRMDHWLSAEGAREAAGGPA